MNPDIWGPKLWFAMHTISLNYPVKPTLHDKKVNKIFNHFTPNFLIWGY